jgi:phosphate/phosphite/phosphonate ABC transporter binding protein
VKLSRRAVLGILSAAALPACRDATIEKRGGADPLAALGQHPKPAALRIGATPFAGERSAKALEPLARFLERELGVPASIIIAKKYDDLADLVRNGAVELGFFSPAAYVKARDAMPAVPIATATRAGSPTYLGYLVVRGNDPATELAGLRGKSIAWVDSSSTSGYLYPRALIRSRGYDPNTFFGRAVMAGDHDKALDMLLAGDVEVAAVTNHVVDRPRTDRAAAVRGLRVIAKSGRIPLDCLVVHSAVDREFAARVRAGLFGLAHSVEASDALAADWGIRGFVPFSRERYDDLDAVLRAGA